MSPLVSSLAGKCDMVLVISSPVSGVSCFARALCNSLAAPHCPLLSLSCLLFRPPTSPCHGAAGCCEHWPLQALEAGVLQERVHSTDVWSGSDAASLLALGGELCGVNRTWLMSTWWGMLLRGPAPLSQGSGLAAAVGQWGCHVLFSFSGLWTPVGGCGCGCGCLRRV